MKRWIILLICLCMLLLATACNRESDDVYRIGVAVFQFDDNFMTLYRLALEEKLHELEKDGIRYTLTIVDGKNDMATQTEQIESFLVQGMDLIICNLVQTSSAERIIRRVTDMEVPMILINREPLAYDKNGKILYEQYEGITENARICYIGADARQSGTMQGRIIAELPNHGDINGDGVISYVMIQGDPENIDTQYRTTYSIKALTDVGLQVHPLLVQVGDWATDKGQQITASALTAFGDQVEVIFCNNDAMAIGAAAAIRAAGRTVGKDIYLVGVDGLAECREMVQNGTMTGTVLNDHERQAEVAVQVAKKLLKQEPIQDYYWVDYLMFTGA